MEQEGWTYSKTLRFANSSRVVLIVLSGMMPNESAGLRTTAILRDVDCDCSAQKKIYKKASIKFHKSSGAAKKHNSIELGNIPYNTDLRDLVQIQNTILEERLEISVASSPWSPNHGRTKIKKEKQQKLPRRNRLREEELRVKKTQTNKQTLTLLMHKLASYSYR